MRRRQFIGLMGGAVAWPMVARAQQPALKMPTIGFLAPGSKTTGRFYSGFPDGMRELGYLEGRDYVLEQRYADGDLARLLPLAEELVRRKPDIIVTGTNVGALAAKQASGNIPIVAITLSDPVRAGLVASEAHPQSNVTGTLIRLTGLTGKQLEIALDLLPGVTTVGLLVNVDNPSSRTQRQEAESVAAKLGLTLVICDVRVGADLGSAIEKFVRERVNVALVLSDVLFVTMRRQIAALALAARLPTVFYLREHVEDGGLISYGIDLRANYRRAAYYVDRILRGEKPADLPIEFLTKLELVINKATANALGLTVPPTLLARADEVIE